MSGDAHGTREPAALAQRLRDVALLCEHELDKAGKVALVIDHPEELVELLREAAAALTAPSMLDVIARIRRHINRRLREDHEERPNASRARRNELDWLEQCLKEIEADPTNGVTMIARTDFDRREAAADAEQHVAQLTPCPTCDGAISGCPDESHPWNRPVEGLRECEACGRLYDVGRGHNCQWGARLPDSPRAEPKLILRETPPLACKCVSSDAANCARYRGLTGCDCSTCHPIAALPRATPAPPSGTLADDGLAQAHEDLRAILRSLGLFDGARPESPHAVVVNVVLPKIAAITEALASAPVACGTCAHPENCPSCGAKISGTP